MPLDFLLRCAKNAFTRGLPFRNPWSPSIHQLRLSWGRPNEAVRLEIFLCNSCIVMPPCGAGLEADWHWLPGKVNPGVVNLLFP